MVQKSQKFTPQTLLSAPRRSAGVPRADGIKVLYTTSTYSFETHKKTTELRFQEIKTGAGLLLARDEDVSDLNWMNGDEFACLCAGKYGITKLCIGDASWGVGPDDRWKTRHYKAGTIDAPAGNLKIAKLDNDGDEWAVVVSAQASKDGSLFNSEKAKATHSTGRLYDSLYVRHWDHYETKEKNALWYGKLSKDKHGKYRLSKLTNATTANRLESPTPPFGGGDNFDVGKDCIIFTAKDPDLDPALNVKTNVYISRITDWDGGSSTLLKVVVPGFEGASSSPVLSADGTKAAFLGMRRAGYESDKNQIFVLLGLSSKELTAQRAFASNGNFLGDWDRSPSSVCFSGDANSLLLVAEDYGTAKLYSLDADITKDTKPTALTTRGYVTDCKPLSGGQIFITATSLIDNSIFAIVDPMLPPGKPHQQYITWSHSNSGGGNKFGLDSSQVGEIWTPASNTKILEAIHSLVVKPSNFDASKTYPVAYLIHGGPQGAWGDSWSTRWNPAVFAEQGYIVIAPNQTGSTGYGQEFTDSIRKNWGGDPYQDIVNCFEWVGKHMPQADNDRAVALGASYGGYMMNWIQGHDLGRKFKCLVCHDGIFSTAGMLATEEVFFPFFDLGGTPWFNPFPNSSAKADAATTTRRNFGATTFSDWRRWDPAEHLDEWDTPELIIHSSKDFRIAIADGMSAFNVLQARGVESRFLTFPDENHWVLKPENSLVWHKVVLNWINHYVGLPAFTDEDSDSEEFWGGTREAAQEVIEMPFQGKPEM